MNLYQKASLLLAIVLYFPLAYQIVKGSVKQNFATFIMWGSLDAVAGLSLMVLGGNFQLPLVYVGGCSVVLAAILYSGVKPEWTKFEAQMGKIVILSLVAWVVVKFAVSGPWGATVATVISTFGVVFGGLPQLRDSWERPQESPLSTYVGFTVVNALSTIGGTAWTVEERLYPFCCVLLCTAIVGASLRRQPSVNSL